MSLNNVDEYTGKVNDAGTFSQDQQASVEHCSSASTLRQDEPSAAGAHGVLPPKGAEKRKLRRTKKPQEMPSRPLSAYNLFFKEARVAWLAEADQIAVLEQENNAACALLDAPGNPDGTKPRKKSRLFEKMAKEIGRRWKELTPTRKQKYEELAELDKGRYRQEMSVYQEKLVLGGDHAENNSKSKKIKKTPFKHDAQQHPDLNVDSKPRARSNPATFPKGTTRHAGFDSLPHNGLSTTAPPSRQSSGSVSGHSSRAGSMNAAATSATSISTTAGANTQLFQQALSALDNQRKVEELRLMAAATVGGQRPLNPAVDWQQIMGFANLSNAPGAHAQGFVAPPTDLQNFLQEQQRLTALGMSYRPAHGQNSASVEDHLAAVVRAQDQQQPADPFQGQDTSNLLRLLVQQELERRTPLAPQHPFVPNSESSICQQQIDAMLRSQEHQHLFQSDIGLSNSFGQSFPRREQQFQNVDATSSLTRTIMDQHGMPQRLHSNDPNAGSLSNNSDVLWNSSGSASQGSNPSNPYEAMALLAYLSQQEQHMKSQQKHESDNDRD